MMIRLVYVLLAIMALGAPSTGLRAAMVQSASAKKSIEDTWQGTVHADKDWRTVIKIVREPDGKFASTVFSIDRDWQPAAVTATTFRDGEVKLDIDAMGAVFHGKLSPDGNSIVGEWKQGEGTPAPIVLMRATTQTAWVIPEARRAVPPMDPGANPSWEVATIKLAPPDEKGKGLYGPARHFGTHNTTLNDLIAFAYHLNARQVQGGPAWMESEKFDIATGEPNVPGAPSDAQLERMMQELLVERFGLKFHMTSQQMSAYVITVANDGPRLKPTIATEPNDNAFYFPGKLGNLVYRNIDMDRFALRMESAVFDRPVVNHTGVRGHFDGTLKWTPDETQFAVFHVKIVPDEAADAPPPIAMAMEQQMGLHLSAEKTAVDVMVVEHVEKPSDN